MALTLFDRNFGLKGRRGDAVRAMGCMLAHHPLHTCRAPIVAAHARARGMGGVKGDSGDLFNVCQGAHVEYGEYGSGMRSQATMKYELSPTLRAVEVKLELDARFGGPEPCWRCEGIDEHTPMCSTMESVQQRREDEYDERL